MHKGHIFFHFLRDQFALIFTYFLNTAFIVLFYVLLTKGAVSFLYPVFISTFILTIYLIIKYLNYKSHLIKLKASNKTIELNFRSSNSFLVQVEDTINLIHKDYLQELNSIKGHYREKEHLFSQWVHNIKTPVSVIDLIIQKQDHTEIFNELDEENKKVINQLDQLLNFIRLDNFSKDLVPERVDLGEQIKQLINNRKKEFIHNNLYPKMTTLNTKHFVLTDYKWNKFVINQLVSNAIKYSSIEDNKNSKRLFFTIKESEESINLIIKDEGIGIHSHDLKRVFDPFFTGENGRLVNGATGIGLYVVKKVCNKLGHRIKIKSEPTIGTEVTISYKIERFNKGS